MTIHKSKGLEFEVVIVPELQARSRHGETRLLSWLERGLPPETLPINSKAQTKSPSSSSRPCNPKAPIAAPQRSGSTASIAIANRRRSAASSTSPQPAPATNSTSSHSPPAKKTRTATGPSRAERQPARHRMARPAIRDRATLRPNGSQPDDCAEQRLGILESLAASADSNLLVMPAPIQPTMLRRLPADYKSTLSSPFAAEMAGAPSIRQLRRMRGIRRLAGNSGSNPLPASRRRPALPRTGHCSPLISRRASRISARPTTGPPHAPPSSSSNPASPRRSAQPASTPPSPQPSPPKRFDSPSTPPTTPPATGFSLRTPKTQAKSAGPASSPAPSAHVQVDRLFRAGLTPLSNRQ